MKLEIKPIYVFVGYNTLKDFEGSLYLRRETVSNMEPLSWSWLPRNNKDTDNLTPQGGKWNAPNILSGKHSCWSNQVSFDGMDNSITKLYYKSGEVETIENKCVITLTDDEIETVEITKVEKVIRYSPKYEYLFDPDTILTSSSSLNPGDKVHIVPHDDCTVDEVKNGVIGRYDRNDDESHYVATTCLNDLENYHLYMAQCYCIKKIRKGWI